MKRIFDTVKANVLFRGISYSDFELMMKCIQTKTRAYMKDEIMLMTGDTAIYVVIIISGSVRVVREERNGRESILAELGATEAFGELFACAGITHSPVTAIANEDTELLLMDFKRVIKICSKACEFHTKLISNMLQLLARTAMDLYEKNDILSKRTTREKLLTFFDAYRGTAKKFVIPYTREELSKYICVDRSAMSSELSKMRRDGLVEFNRNSFEVLY